MNVATLTETQLALAVENEDLEKRALVDDLTRIWNRPAILEIVERELHAARITGKHCAILSLDIDHFKQINDTHGHPGGDEVLREVSARLRGAIRPSDAVGRVGGEEFLIVLPGCSREGALTAGERVRSALRATPIAVPGVSLTVTVSVGVACSAESTTADAILLAADGALYSAKRGGRDRVA